MKDQHQQASDNSTSQASSADTPDALLGTDLLRIIHDIPEGLLVISSNATILMASRQAGARLGVDHEELIAQPVGRFLHMKGLPVDRALLDRCEHRDIELQVWSNQPAADLAFTAVRITDSQTAAGTSEGSRQAAYILLARDISERKHAMEKIRKLTRLIEDSPSVIMRIDESLHLQYVNAAGRDFAKAHDCRVGNKVSGTLAETVREVLRTRTKCRREQDALDRTWSVLYQPVRGEHYVNVYGSDITERVHIERELLHSAFYDELTELPNRALFRDHVDSALHALKRRPQRTFAVIQINLVRFRFINETYGHSVGDQLLKACGRRLQKLCRARDTVARVSADAFCVLQSRIDNAEDAATAAQRLLDTFAESFQLGKHELFVSACAGVAVVGPEYETAEALIRDADTALYRAKDRGPGNYRLFDATMQDRMRRFLSLEAKLRHAIRHNEFEMHYQPKVSVEGRLCGFESLLRWPGPDDTMTSPAEFVPVAEGSGLIIDLGNWINHAVCEQVRSWQDALDNPVPVAINISGQQFERKGFVKDFRSILDDHGVRPELIHAEITESSLMGEIWSVVKRLKRLADIGIVSAIDDFGTGYSSLSYLKQFPVSYLKVDQAFVRDMHTNEEDYAITSAIVAMAHQLRLKVIAEGVENQTHLSMLSALDCDQIQGYYFSKPLPAEQAREIIERGGIMF